MRRYVRGFPQTPRRVPSAICQAGRAAENRRDHRKVSKRELAQDKPKAEADINMHYEFSQVLLRPGEFWQAEHFMPGLEEPSFVSPSPDAPGPAKLCRAFCAKTSPATAC